MTKVLNTKLFYPQQHLKPWQLPRNYSVNKIVSLIYNPQPQNWPGYSTEMMPMPQVPKADAQKIAQWIRSLKSK